MGREYPTTSGPRTFEPVILVADPAERLLSFRNLVEVHVLSAIRRKHQVRLQEVRGAVEYLRKHFQSQHPLADQEMKTDGINLFIEQYGKLVNVSREGQLAMREVLSDHLDRIERDPKGIAIRLYPFSGRPERRTVAIDPRVKYGRPCIIGTGIPTDIIAGRFTSGDSIKEIADDYGRPSEDIEEAIRFENAA